MTSERPGQLEEPSSSDAPGTAMESAVSGGVAAFATALAAAHPGMAVPIAGTAAGIQAWLPRARTGYSLAVPAASC
jgi:hypothetical protein